jgi:hypothetical protein
VRSKSVVLYLVFVDCVVVVFYLLIFYV